MPDHLHCWHRFERGVARNPLSNPKRPGVRGIELLKIERACCLCSLSEDYLQEVVGAGAPAMVGLL